MTKILLASGSFLRRFIMDTTNLPYEIKAADIDETVFDHLAVGERVVKLAEKKCEKIATNNSDAIVIAADTLTTNEEGLVYTKLTGSEEPFKAALALSGKTIQVFTGCAVYTRKSGIETFLALSKITYQEFSEETLKRVTKDDDHTIRSGALGVFHDAPGFTLIKKIEGSYTGAFGLPMEFINPKLLT